MRAGILIIGSLLWGNQGREPWRQLRLNIDQQVSVRVPIRYGRLSTSRGNTFTMTFAPEDNMGRALLVPCKAPIDDIQSLIAEAEALWMAEDRNASSSQIGKSWGCVGALFRQGTQLGDLKQRWAAHFSRKVSKPIPPVDNTGVLNTPWPKIAPGDVPVDMDVILVTATKPYKTPPTAEKVARAWLDQQNGCESYFFENVRNCIRTPEDSAIWQKLKERMPEEWRTNPSYAKAIAILDEEAAQGGA